MTASNSKEVWLGLDVGEKRIGVAKADSIGRIAAPVDTLETDGMEIVTLQRMMCEHEVTGMVVGLPRNMAGEQTAQTEVVRQFVTRRLEAFDIPIKFQDESLTSVAAERELQQRGKPYTKGDIDALAATLILQDYMEVHYGY